MSEAIVIEVTKERMRETHTGIVTDSSFDGFIEYLSSEVDFQGELEQLILGMYEAFVESLQDEITLAINRTGCPNAECEYNKKDKESRIDKPEIDVTYDEVTAHGLHAECQCYVCGREWKPKIPHKLSEIIGFDFKQVVEENNETIQ